MLKLVLLVEGEIKEEMNGTKRAILFDGCSSSRTHYVGIFVSYCTPLIVSTTANPTKILRPRLTLISVSAMAHCSAQIDERGNRLEKATSFNASTNTQFIKDVFQFYGQDF